jgi:hypothetical protein
MILTGWFTFCSSFRRKRETFYGFHSIQCRYSPCGYEVDRRDLKINQSNAALLSHP